MPTEESTVSKAGITTSASGERHIPSSTRADGSVRKEIRVRPGYRPPEDVEIYKNRTAEAWKNRGSGGVPGAEGLKSEEPKSAAANKNAKRREARKKAAAAQTDDQQDIKPSNAPETQGESGNSKEAAAPPAPLDLEAEKEKEAKKLSKKLRQAKDLKEKKESGAALLPEQFEKVIKITELIRQLDALGFDADGKKKAET